MEFLRGLWFALNLVGCYSPELADCTVTCSSDGDCGDGQSCGEQGLCSAGATCTPAGSDAAVTADSPDATPQTMLRVKITDQGVVNIPDQTQCTMELSECSYTVDRGVEIQLTAEPLNDRIFEKWEEACTGQLTPTCTITPTGPELKVTAKFKRAPRD